MLKRVVGALWSAVVCVQVLASAAAAQDRDAGAEFKAAVFL